MISKHQENKNKAKQNLAQNSRNAAPSILPLRSPQTWGESAVLSHNHVPSSNSHCAENRHKSLSCVSSTLPKFFGIRASWSVAQRRGLSSSGGRKPAGSSLAPFTPRTSRPDPRLKKKPQNPTKPGIKSPYLSAALPARRCHRAPLRGGTGRLLLCGERGARGSFIISDPQPCAPAPRSLAGHRGDKYRILAAVALIPRKIMERG